MLIIHICSCRRTFTPDEWEALPHVGTMRDDDICRSEFARLGNSRVKSNQRLRDAENMQPWRCAKCNTPVRKGMGDPCKCFQPERRSREMPLEGLTFLIEAPGDRTVGDGDHVARVTIPFAVTDPEYTAFVAEQLREAFTFIFDSPRVTVTLEKNP